MRTNKLHTTNISKTTSWFFFVLIILFGFFGFRIWRERTRTGEIISPDVMSAVVDETTGKIYLFTLGGHLSEMPSNTSTGALNPTQILEFDWKTLNFTRTQKISTPVAASSLKLLNNNKITVLDQRRSGPLSHVLNIKDGSENYQVPSEYDFMNKYISWTVSDDGKVCACLQSNGIIDIWDINGNRIEQSFALPGPIKAISINDNGTRIFAEGLPESSFIWSKATGIIKVKAICPGVPGDPEAGLEHSRFAPKGDRVICRHGIVGGHFDIYDCLTGESLGQIDEKSWAGRAYGFLADSSIYLGLKTEIQFWSKDGLVHYFSLPHSGEPLSYSFLSPDNKLLVIKNGGGADIYRLWPKVSGPYPLKKIDRVLFGISGDSRYAYGNNMKWHFVKEKISN